MTRRTKGSKILPLAMTVALAGTSWIGLAGGPVAPAAQAQRGQDKDQDDQDRRRGDQRQREEKPRERRQEKRQERAQERKQERPQERSQERSRERAGDRGGPRGGERQGERAAPERSEQRAVQPQEQERGGRGREERRERTPPQQVQPQQPPEPGRPDFRRASPPGRSADEPQREGERRFRRPDQARPTQPEPSRERGEADRRRPDSPPEPGRPDFARPDGRPDGKRPDGLRPADGPRRPGASDGRSAEGRERHRGLMRLDEVKRGRVERQEGGRRVIEEPGNRVIIREKNRMVIRRDEGRAFERFGKNTRSRDLGEGRRETWFERPDGTRVYSEVDRNGRLLRRWRRDRGGREVTFIDNRRFYRNLAIGVGVGALGIGAGLALAAPHVTIPRDRYIVDYEGASDDDLYEALSAPPIGRLERGYSLEEIRYSAPLRDHMRRIDLDTINFEFGSFEVAEDQYPKLARLARIIQRMLERNEAEMLLIEGHTDAVGSDEDNLTLSDRRAESVADILVQEFSVPAENLVTQGYGEQYLKIETEAAERQNRRVALRRITPLLGEGRDR